MASSQGEQGIEHEAQQHGYSSSKVQQEEEWKVVKKLQSPTINAVQSVLQNATFGMVNKNATEYLSNYIAQVAYVISTPLLWSDSARYSKHVHN